VVSDIAANVRKAWLGAPIAPPVPRNRYDPPAAALAQIAGEYAIPHAIELRVRASAGGLELENESDGIAYSLEPVAPDTFYFRPLYALLTFHRNTAGDVTGLDWNGQFTLERK